MNALVWFWIIDETYGLILSAKCVDMKGWSHAKWWSKRMIMVDDDDQKMVKCFTFGKEEREKQKPR